MAEERYESVRDPDILGPFLGATIVDITQHDEEEFKEDGRSYIALHFDNGYTLKVWVGDEGFEIEAPDSD